MSGWLDRAIEALSPRWGAGRAYYREALELSRAYDAGKVGRRVQGWLASGGSGNAELAGGFERVRNRARDLVMNNPYAAKAVRSLAAHVVGSGITPRPALGDAAVKRRIRADWDGFAEACDYDGVTDLYGLQAQVVRTMVESGEALVRLHWSEPQPGSPIPIRLQALEPDYLDASRTETLADGGVIIMGVELGPDRRRRAYWLHDRHPGDQLTGLYDDGFQSRRVDAGHVLHVFDRQRAGRLTRRPRCKRRSWLWAAARRWPPCTAAPIAPSTRRSA